MTDLIERLRMRQRQGWIHNPGETPHLGAYRPDPDCTEAADKIEHLTAENLTLHSTIFSKQLEILDLNKAGREMTASRDEYQRATDKLARENKTLRDAATAYADAQERMAETCEKTDGSWDISVDQYYAAKKQLLLAVAAARGTT